MMFLREVKKTIFSVPFIVLVVVLFLMAYSQGVLSFNEYDKIEKPLPGYDNYGVKMKEDPNIIMPAALNDLYLCFQINQYTTYPIGFYKSVTLNETKNGLMADILSQLSGISTSNLLSQNSPQTLTPAAGLDYETYKTLMKSADKLLGEGSSYNESGLLSFGKVPMTYEEALDNYSLTKTVDHFNGSHARLFTDYIVIILSILPVFPAVIISLKDRRYHMESLIYTRKISSGHIVFTRFAALVVTAFIPSLILAYVSNVSCWKLYPGEAFDYLAPLKYTLGWLLPSLMISTAAGMFLTELTDTPLAIIVQGLWWFIDINIGITNSGNYSLFNLAPRHNSLQATDYYIRCFGSLVANRIFFAAAAIVLIIITAVIFELKRKGVYNGIRLHKKSTAAAE